MVAIKREKRNRYITMKITKNKLKQIIEEEIQEALEEIHGRSSEDVPVGDVPGVGEESPVETLRRVKDLVQQALDAIEAGEGGEAITRGRGLETGKEGDEIPFE
jgi:hypothetical protein